MLMLFGHDVELLWELSNLFQIIIFKFGKNCNFLNVLTAHLPPLGAPSLIANWLQDGILHILIKFFNLNFAFPEIYIAPPCTICEVLICLKKHHNLSFVSILRQLTNSLLTQIDPKTSSADELREAFCRCLSKQ